MPARSSSRPRTRARTTSTSSWSSKTDLEPTALPTDENGAVVETGEGIELIGEIEDIPVGETQSVTLDLEAGNYVLICNIFDEGEQEAHYQEGMRTTFTVS